MSTHVTYFCDHCNSDHHVTRGDDRGHAVNYDEAPTYDGWAAFRKPSPWSERRAIDDEFHVCAHCLADPEFDASEYGEASPWDDLSKANLETGRVHAARFVWARENLGTRGRWGWSGVHQTFPFHAHSHRQHGPRLQDGRFSRGEPAMAGSAA